MFVTLLTGENTVIQRGNTLSPNTLCVFVWVFYRLGSIRNISRELKQITSKDKKHLGKKQYIKSLTSLY